MPDPSILIEDSAKGIDPYFQTERLITAIESLTEVLAFSGCYNGVTKALFPERFADWAKEYGVDNA